MVFHESIFQGRVWTNLFVEKVWSLFFKLYTVVFWNSIYAGVHSTCMHTLFLVWADRERGIDVQ